MSEHRTVAGTDIHNVKEKNANSGMSYNEAKEFIARTTGGHNTNIYSDTNVEQVKKEIQNNEQEKR
ncbi:gamma-type small acid-soluble spore protein [Radiobacillus kanasensis]|uniref:gamma-type small acid-soluble spore protein n=1 Tax=Radiobacillus kanasensis TaxID=2844358 RepID=UPI001E2CB78F|nr:gamma-type small acid-soluble spore protein [Radiobacillus kanasensis]UFT99023.1 gamma-type small acid-soluble spore protein [Radiobacillus kanasensis]